MAEYERGGQLSDGELLSQNSSQYDQRQSREIQGKKLIIRYGKHIEASLSEVQAWYQALFNDSDLKIVKSSWSDTGQMFLVVLSRRRKLSIQKWKAKLNAQDIQPRIILYDATLYEALTNEYECHWPQKYSSKLRNLMKKTTSMEQFVEENVSEIKNLSKLSQNIEFYENLKLQRALKSLKYQKKRGIWLFGLANSGKTTLGMKYLEPQQVYFKDMTTETFDHYKGEQNIFMDEMNIDNSKRLLPILKNLVNCIPGRLNVKFGTRMIYPKNVIVTTQYQLDTLTKDEALIAAIKERFFFYYVQRLESCTTATQYLQIPNDLPAATQIVYDLQIGRILSSSQYFRQQVAKMDDLEFSCLQQRLNT